nr:reverse transcriptase domain-containing protein [Tanacetum cinerariifolium]
MGQRGRRPKPGGSSSGFILPKPEPIELLEWKGYFQILVTPEDQEKTRFTCLYAPFAYKRMPFGLCNALAIFQRYMMAIFHELIEDDMEVLVGFKGLHGVTTAQKLRLLTDEDRYYDK